MLTPETILQGRYRIIRQLGQGGMGAVYEAVDARLDTTVALKETLFADERLRKQFEREARLLARMHHPALPRVSDHFSEGEGQFLVMQFITGDDLAEKITHRRGPFPADQVLTWADQLLDALDYLHTQDPQIIHRDIKPQNLKLTARGQIILLDFGLAKGQASEVSRVTTSASIFGYTPNYAPLEQIQGLGTDARSDIYALGATLYHLLTGVKPPDALTRAAALVNGQADPLKPAHEVNSSVAAGVSSVLQRAMAQNRDHRFANAAEMRRAFQSIGAGDTVPIRSEANTVLFPPSRLTASPETRASVRQPTVQTGETTVLRQPDKSRKTPWAIAAGVVLLLAVGVAGFYAFQRRNNAAAVVEPPANSQPSPVTTESIQVGESSASTTVSEDSKKVEAEKQQVAAEEKAVKKQEKTTRQREAANKHAEDKAATVDPDRATGEGSAQEDPVVHPQTPQVPPPGVPRFGQPGPNIRAGGVTIRNFPDGSQLITSPDGSRVLVRPDGTRRVFRPGEKLDRRRVFRQP
ncbi:MAG: protein kinase domain-containing protein [Pyrinomonadaceae bacterium]